MPFSEFKSFSDVRDLMSNLPGPDAAARSAATEREPQLTKPAGSLGRLEEIAAWLATWQGKHRPALDRVVVQIFAGNHGVAARGVSAFPSDVTAQMVGNFENGGAAINQITRVMGAELMVTALDLENPTQDFSEAPAMSENETLTALSTGWACVSEDMDLLCLGEMGIGNTSAAAAIARGLFGGMAADWVGPGTGVTGSALSRKAEIIEQSVNLHSAHMSDGLDVLCHVGGRELAAMAGAVLAARVHRVPVVLDGYVATAAVASLKACNSSALDHCVAGHVSREPGHRKLLGVLGMEPLLNLDMRLGEGSGAGVAIGLIRAAHACHTGMATFAEAGVSDKA